MYIASHLVRLTCLSTALAFVSWAQTLAPMRPPAVPLIAHDPYFSIWSMADHLNDEGTRHWTGKPNSISAFLRVDGKSYQVIGRDRNAALLTQTKLEVLPTRTIYGFAGAGIDLELTFFTPALPQDLDVLSRPLTYLEWKASANDGKEHDVAVYFDAGSDLVVNTPDQPVTWARYQLNGQPLLRMGSREQPMLAKRGDDLRIDWGYLYLAADRQDGVTLATLDRARAREAFEANGVLPDTDDFASPRNPVLACASHAAAGYLMLAYDDLYSIEYCERRERPLGRRKGAEAADLLRAARAEDDSRLARSRRFDEELMADL